MFCANRFLSNMQYRIFASHLCLLLTKFLMCGFFYCSNANSTSVHFNVVLFTCYGFIPYSIHQIFFVIKAFTPKICV